MADRPNLTDIAGAATFDPPTYNANNQRLKEQADNLLGRGGVNEANNSLAGDLDADGNTIKNARDPVADGELVTKRFGDANYGGGGVEANAAAAAASAADALVSENNAATSEINAGISATNSAASAVVAVAAAASINTPILVGGDAGKHLVVNSSEDGYDLTVAPGLIDVQVFTADGTWTKPTGTTKVEVTAIGGGGGSGGSSGGGSSAAAGGGGGGGAFKFITSGLGVTETVTVGAGGTAGTDPAGTGGTGGTSSFGSHCSATGGAGSMGATTVSPPAFGNAIADGGLGSSGDINLSGARGEIGIVLNTAEAIGGIGGSAAFGFGVSSSNNPTAAQTIGRIGENYGGGASGAANDTAGSGTGGSAGAAGIIIVKSYA